MRAIVAHAPDEDVTAVREVLFGAGFQCHKEDCVAWDQLAARLAKGQVNLVVLYLRSLDRVHRDALQDALLVSSAPKLAVGGTHDPAVSALASELGIDDLVDEKRLEEDLNLALERFRAEGLIASHAGKVISVFAPAPGSGATTVAVHLAASLAKGKHSSVALLELSHQPGDLAVMLDLDPMHTAENVCHRWQRLDQVGLRASFTAHSTGFHVLANSVDCHHNGALNPDAVRRIAVLSRILFANTVIALDGDISEESLTAMRLSDAVVMVVRPDVPAMRRARRASEKAFESGIPREALKVVVNRWGQRGQLSKDQIEHSLHIKPLDVIPDDPANLNRAVNDGQLLHTFVGRSKIVRRFDALAKALVASSS